MLINYLGQEISGERKFLKEEYKNANGDPNWDLLIDSDQQGFYKMHSYPNGNYTRNTVLPVGMFLIRYGDAGGRFVADDGTPYEKLSLPFVKETVEFHKYIVVNPFPVIEGKVAPGFDNVSREHLATQYYTVKSVAEQEECYIKEVFSWIDELK